MADAASSAPLSLVESYGTLCQLEDAARRSVRLHNDSEGEHDPNADVNAASDALAAFRARLADADALLLEARIEAEGWRNEARGSLTLSHPSRAEKERLPWEPRGEAR